MQDVEFRVTNVQVKGGYVLHFGTVSALDSEGKIKVGDKFNLFIDEVRQDTVKVEFLCSEICVFQI